MGRFIRFGFGLAAYVAFFASFLYLVGFVTNLYVPRSIDVGPVVSPALAIIIDLALIAAFGIQHSLMARPAFKSTLVRYFPAAIERSLYVAATAAVLLLLFWAWRPLPTMVYSIQAEWVRIFLWSVAGLGWTIVLVATFLISHFQLFGLHQIWSDLREQPMPEMQFRQPLFYKLVRHPIYSGFLLAFWVTPDMSQGHLLFSIGMTIYIWIGVRYEEQDLRSSMGSVYVDYSKRVGRLIPGLGKTRDSH